MKKVYLLLVALLICTRTFAVGPKLIYTYAGTGAAGNTGDGGLAINATLKNPTKLAIDGAGNIYVLDTTSHVIRKINASTGIITRVAGNGISGYSGDGGPAVNASITKPYSMVADSSGNLYFTDGAIYGHNFCVRKVNVTTGIITTIAGTMAGYSTNTIAPPGAGDGGLAVNANLNSPFSLAIDNMGHLYIGSYYGHQVRKVDLATGIISTVVGTGISGNNGDGGLAVNAQLSVPGKIILDHSGNMYIADDSEYNTQIGWGYYSKIRKVDATTGIITTIAGGGSSQLQTYGNIAANVMLSVNDLAIDNNGNIYMTYYGNPLYGRILKLDPTTGIINMEYGGSFTYYFTEGIPTNVYEAVCENIVLNNLGEMYYTGSYNQPHNKIFKIVNNNFSGNGFLRFTNKLCTGLKFGILPMQPSPNLHVVTWFGDGDSVSRSFVNDSTFNVFTHAYAYSGTYSIKHVLYNGTIALDTQEYSYYYPFCRTLPIRLYYDVNSNCTFDSTDHLLGGPTTLEIDSNGVAIDTVSIFSGMDYSATGNPGDIYQFKAINTAVGLTAVCPSSGIITDTLNVDNIPAKYLGFHCAGASGFDLSVTSTMQTGRHTQKGQITLQNGYCTPQNGIVTLNKSPQFVFTSANPVPSSIHGDTITWNVNNLSSSYIPVTIQYQLDVPAPWSLATWLAPNDTVHSSIAITPITGDMNAANNTNIRIDTVKSSFDPNEMDVLPRRYFQAGEQLQYTIQFENTGNDTAQNISVLDTLSNNLNIQTLAMVASTHSCIFSKKWTGTNWVVKFDFPNIKLLDSSHHNQCTGMLVFNIKAKTGLAVGTSIYNHAAIFFDDNPPVITDTVQSILAIPVTPTVSITANNFCPGIATTFSAAVTNGGTAPTYQWKKNGVNVGTNSATYIYTPVYGDSIKCIVTSNAPLPIPSTVSSNTIYMTVSAAVTPTIVVASSPTGTICAGGTAAFTANITNGGPNPTFQWKKNGVNVGANSSIYNCVPNNGDSIRCVLTSSAACATQAIVSSSTVNMVVAPIVTPTITIAASATGAICAGTTVTYTATISNGGTTPTYQWKVNGTNVGTNSNNYTYAPNNGDTISCVLTSNATCVVPAVVTSSTIIMAVTPTVIPTISITANPNDTVCTGTPVTYTASITNGGTTPGYQWIMNGSNVGTNSSTYTYTPNNGDSVRCVMTSNATCTSQAIVNSNYTHMTVQPMVTPTIAIAASPAGAVCAGTTVAYTATITNGGTSPAYQWKKNGANLGTNNSVYTYTPNNGDSVRCVMTSNNACANPTTANSNSIVETVNPLIIPTITISAPAGAVVGSAVTATATVTNAGSSYTIHWKNRGVAFATTNVPPASGNSTTYTKVAGTDSITAKVVITSGGCYDSATTASYTIVATTVGVSNINSANNMVVYPNPANNILHVDNLTTNVDYQLQNLVGMTVLQGTFTQEQNTLLIKELPSGIYLLQLTDATGQREVVRVVKE